MVGVMLDSKKRMFTACQKRRQIIGTKSDYAKCYICGSRLNFANRTIDHVFPVASGGIDAYCNFQWCCKSCNTSKANKVPSTIYLKQILNEVPIDIDMIERKIKNNEISNKEGYNKAIDLTEFVNKVKGALPFDIIIK